MYRHTSRKDGIEPISRQRFEELIVPLKKQGVSVLYGGEWVEQHLRECQAEASTLGTGVALFSEQVSLSRVLEECYHIQQNMRGLNADKETALREILNEIDAKQYLLDSVEKYQIPRRETELTRKQLAAYRAALEDYLQKQGGYEDVQGH